MISEIIEYFDQRADADQGPDEATPMPNEEMKLLILAKQLEALLFADGQPIAEIDAMERVNGMGEADNAGSYIKVNICLGRKPDQLRFNVKISEGQAQHLRDGLVACGAKTVRLA